jgi:hypothetical protein
MPVSIEKKATDSNTSANSLKNKSPTEVNEKGQERARISPSNIFALWKAKTAVKRGRSAR